MAQILLQISSRIQDEKVNVYNSSIVRKYYRNLSKHQEQQISGKIKDVHNFIQAYHYSCFIGTIWELKEQLEYHFECKLHEMGIGNLLTYPLIIENFNLVREDLPEEIIEIPYRTALDCINKSLFKNKGSKVTPKQIREEVAENLKCSPSHLGIKINRLGFIIKNIRDANANTKQTLHASIHDIQKKIYAKGTKAYSTIEDAQRNKIINKVTRDILNSISPGGTLICSQQLSSLKKKRKTKFKTIAKNNIDKLFNSDSISLHNVLQLETDCYIAYNNAMENNHKIPIASFMEYLSQFKEYNFDDYIVINKNSINNVLDNEKKDDKNDNMDNSITIQIEDNTVIKKYIRNEIMSLLLKNIEQHYSFSQILSILRSNVCKLLCIDDIDILKYIINDNYLSQLLDFCNETFISIIRALRNISCNEDNITEDNLIDKIYEFTLNYDKEYLSKYSELYWDLIIFFKEQNSKQNIEPCNNIYYYDKHINNSISLNNNNISSSIIDKINSLPFGIDINDALNWNEYYILNEGSLINFLYRYETQIVGQCFIFSNGCIMHQPQQLLIENKFQFNIKQISPKHFANYLIQYLYNNRSSINTINSEISDYLNKNQITLEDSTIFFVKVIENIPSDTLKAYIIQNIILQSLSILGGDSTIQNLFADYWNYNDINRLFKLGNILGYNNWITYERKSHNTIILPKINTLDNIPNIEEKSIPLDNTPIINETIVEEDTTIVPVNTKIVVTENNTNAKEFIETLLRNKFGVGLDNNIESDLYKVHQNFKNLTENSLNRLAGDLYSEDVHFIMEIIQNADDNIYLKNTIPTLRFNINNDKICIGNNEIGFSNNNILALCSIGESTKENKKGYIGKKGIGFKSVFRISDAPEIHSNGFHINFDITEDKLGYIKPTWLDNISDTKLKTFIDENITTIALPFKNTYEEKDRTKLRDEIVNCSSNLILFLNTLKSLEIYDNILERKRIINRIDDKNNKIVKIYDKINNIEYNREWLRIEKSIKIYNTNKISSIVLAFPIESNTNGKWKLKSQDNYEVLPLFAYLPTKFTDNLYFIIHADFIVPSSREYIDIDNEQNQCIRDYLSSTFIESINTIIQESDNDIIDIINSIIPYMPLKCSSLYLHDLPKQIGNKIKHEKIFFDNTKILRYSSELLYFTKSQRDIGLGILSDISLYNYINKTWLHPGINIPYELAELCGISRFNINHASEFLKKYIEKENPSIFWVRNYIITIYRLFSSSEYLLFKELFQIPWIPLVKSPNVFIEPNKYKKILLLHENYYSLFSGINELNIIDNRIFGGMSDKDKKDLFIIFDNLKNIIYCDNIIHYISNLIIPLYSNINNGKDDNNIMKLDKLEYNNIVKLFTIINNNQIYSSILQLQQTNNSHIIDKLKEHMILPLHKEPNCVKINIITVHRKTEYNSQLPSILKNIIPWNLVSIKPQNEDLYRLFGIFSGPKITKDEECIELNSIIDFMNSPLCSKNHINILQKFLIHVLSSKEYSEYLNMPNFINIIRSKNWIYCNLHQTLHKPSIFYIDTCNATQYFGDDTCILSSSDIPKKLIRILNIQEEVSTQSLISFIHSLYKKYFVDNDKIILLSEQDNKSLQRIYNQLIPLFNKEKWILDKLNDIPWIFYPSNYSTTQREGNFYTSHEIYTTDPANVLYDWGKPIFSLATTKYIPDSLKQLLRIVITYKYPEPVEYFSSFKKIKDNIPNEILINQVWKLLDYWGNSIPNNYFENIKMYLNLGEFFPVKQGDSIIWKTHTECKLYYFSNPDISDKFINSISLSNNLNILATPDTITNSHILLFNECEIIDLSNYIDTSICVKDEKLDLNLYNCIKKLLPLFERYCRTKMIYHKVDQYIHFFQNLNLYNCSELSLEYSIKLLDNIEPIYIKKNCIIDTTEKCIYYQGFKLASATKSLIKEFSKLFFPQNIAFADEFIDIMKNPAKSNSLMDKGNFTFIYAYSWKLGDIKPYKQPIKIIVDPTTTDKIYTQSFEELNNLPRLSDTTDNIDNIDDTDDQNIVEIEYLGEHKTNSPQYSKNSLITGNKPNFIQNNHSINEQNKITSYDNKSYDSNNERGITIDFSSISDDLNQINSDTWNTIYIEQQEFQIPNITANSDIAKIAEYLAYKYLTNKFPNKDIIWVNEEQESAKPYDIVIDKNHFIEVKSTTEKKCITPFPISSAELEFAKGHNYDIFRIFDVNGTPELLVISNVNNKIQKKQIILCMQLPNHIDS